MQQQSTLKSLQVLHSAMLAGQIVFASIAIFLKNSNNFASLLADKDSLLQIIALAVSFAGFFISSNIFKKKVATARDSPGSIKEKAAKLEVSP